MLDLDKSGINSNKKILLNKQSTIKKSPPIFEKQKEKNRRTWCQNWT
jgi:hypothetical protein